MLESRFGGVEGVIGDENSRIEIERLALQFGRVVLQTTVESGVDGLGRVYDRFPVEKEADERDEFVPAEFDFLPDLWCVTKKGKKTDRGVASRCQKRGRYPRLYQ